MPGGKQSSKDNTSEHKPLQSLPTLSLNVPVSLRERAIDVAVAVGAPGARAMRAFDVTSLDACAVGFAPLRVFTKRGARRLDAFAEGGVRLDAFAERDVWLDALRPHAFARTFLAQRIEVATLRTLLRQGAI